MKWIPDVIERGEMRIEAWADKNIHGDNFTCCCGNTCPLDDAVMMSPDPNGTPACPECAREHFEAPQE